MMTNCKNIILCFIVLLFFSVKSFAFDGQRKGILVGAGIGPANDGNFSEKLTPITDRVDKTISYDFKLGYGLNNKDIIFLNVTNLQSFFDNQFYNYSLSFLTSLSYSHYFSEKSNSYYYSFGFGRSSYSYENLGDLSGTGGIGIKSEIGYEFLKSLQISGFHIISWSTDEAPHFRIQQFGFIVELLAY